MELIIDVTENHLKTLQKMNECGLGYYHRAILNGTPLPKGHGRLIDADAYLAEEKPRGINEDTWKESHTYKSITEAPTIIEADKENKQC